MRNFIALYFRELENYFVTPIGYAILGSFWLANGFFFSFNTLFISAVDMVNAFHNMSILLLLMVPLMTMRWLFRCYLAWCCFYSNRFIDFGFFLEPDSGCRIDLDRTISVVVFRLLDSPCEFKISFGGNYPPIPLCCLPRSHKRRD